tara:strand:+ start:479 stop:694 length:216 start_codon:yes stop_codon:yes gene_type:complete
MLVVVEQVLVTITTVQLEFQAMVDQVAVLMVVVTLVALVRQEAQTLVAVAVVAVITIVVLLEDLVEQAVLV